MINIIFQSWKAENRISRYLPVIVSLGDLRITSGFILFVTYAHQYGFIHHIV